MTQITQLQRVAKLCVKHRITIQQLDLTDTCKFNAKNVQTIPLELSRMH